MFDVGTIFTWDNFPYYDDPNSTAKKRWFLYLGRMPVTESPIFVFLITATSQLSHYTTGGDRTSNPHIIFRAGQCGFDKDSVLDASWGFYQNVTESFFEESSVDFEAKGQLSNEQLRQVFEILWRSRRISKVILRDIRRNLQSYGVSGLRRV